MKIIVVSDTHREHDRLGTLEADVLIHCGDFCLGDRTAADDLAAIDAWFGRQRAGLVLCTAGNHDFLVEEWRSQGRPVFRHARLLQDEGVAFGGRLFWGAPWVPELAQWAHYRDPAAIRAHWARIPPETDVLITHTPPAGVLDRTSGGRHCGCPDLLARVEQVGPSIHCFGHVHASAGRLVRGPTKFVNAAVVDGSYRIARAPCVLQL